MTFQLTRIFAWNANWKKMKRKIAEKKTCAWDSVHKVTSRSKIEMTVSSTPTKHQILLRRQSFWWATMRCCLCHMISACSIQQSRSSCNIYHNAKKHVISPHKQCAMSIVACRWCSVHMIFILFNLILQPNVIINIFCWIFFLFNHPLT